jgi:hypothetical protein
MAEWEKKKSVLTRTRRTAAARDAILNSALAAFVRAGDLVSSKKPDLQRVRSHLVSVHRQLVVNPC